MKEVTIKSKIVGRGGASAATSPGKGVSVDMSGYLLKQIWEKVFEFRLTDDGTEYLFAKMNVAAQGGFTSFVDGGKINLPGLYDGIPFDNRTIWMNPETGVVEVLVSGGEGGAADFSNVQSSGTGNAFTSFNVSADGSRLTLVKGETFALQRVVDELDEKITNFLEGSDTDNIINKWKELEAFLSGLRESDVLSDILSEKADWGTTLAHYGITDAYTKEQVDNLLGNFVTSDDVETLLEDYLPLTGGTITGDLRLRKGSEYTSPYLYFGDSDEVWMKEATDKHLTIHADGSVKIDSPKTVIDGIEIKKSASGVLFIDANLVVSGGITMYGTDGTTANTIWDDAPIASTSVKGIASFDSEFFAVNNGKVTFIGSTGDGGIESITKQMVIDALGFTPYDEDNPDGFITGITKSMVTTALGYTPYNSTNPSGYITGITKSMVTTALGYTPYNSTNPSGYITGITKSMVTTALGFTPYNATNPNGYITSSGSITGNAATATTLKNARTLWGNSFDGSANVSGNIALSTSKIFWHGDSNNYYISCPADTGGAGLMYKAYSSHRFVAGGAERLTILSSGYIGIGTTNPQSKLQVDQSGWANGITINRTVSGGGSAIAVRSNGTHVGNFGISGSKQFEFSVMSGTSEQVKMTVDSSGNGLFYGGVTMYSDLRKKTILNHVELSLKEVADAPLIEHYYNSDESKRTHVGSVAQYWAGLNDWFCKEDEEGFLTMEIQNAALASAISVARELTRYESKTDKQIKKLKKRIGELEEEIENLKKM